MNDGDMRSEPAAKRCDTCQFWEHIDPTQHGLDTRLAHHDGDHGYCRRHPPTVVVRYRDEPASMSWPRTKRGEWCGEHRKGDGSAH